MVIEIDYVESFFCISVNEVVLSWINIYCFIFGSLEFYYCFMRSIYCKWSFWLKRSLLLFFQKHLYTSSLKPFSPSGISCLPGRTVPMRCKSLSHSHCPNDGLVKKLSVIMERLEYSKGWTSSETTYFFIIIKTKWILPVLPDLCQGFYKHFCRHKSENCNNTGWRYPRFATLQEFV